MNLSFKVLLPVAFSLLFPSLGHGATIHVPTDYSTIQAAIVAAADGDTVLVAPGNYVENISFKGKAITVISSHGPGVTLIDGQANAMSVVRFINGEGPDSVLEGFTLTNGKGTYHDLWGKCGGGVYCKQVSPTLINNIITGNGASYGGGIACFGNSTPTIHYHTIVKNSATKAGGAICLHYSDAVIHNSIIWNSTSIYLSYPSIAYSCIKGGWPGMGNIDQNPLFLDAEGGDFRLKQHPCQPGAVNPCVDTGDPASPLPEGSTRSDFYPDEGVVDMGCHYPVGILVPDDFPTIQAAIDGNAAFGGILVRPGTYVENIDFKGKAVSVVSLEGPEVTVIDGYQAGPVVILENVPPPGGWIKGFTLRNGLSLNGGGVHCSKAALKLEENVITANTASGGHGGGVYCEAAAVTIRENHIHSNTCSLDGGGLFCLGDSPLIQDTTVRDNTAGGSGGGIWCSGDFAVIQACILQDNAAGADAGGIHHTGTDSALVDNEINGNSAVGSGGGILSDGEGLTLQSNAVYGNSAGVNGGGLACFHADASTLEDTELHGNAANASGGGIYLEGGAPALRKNTVHNNSAGLSGGGMAFVQAHPFLDGNTLFNNLAGSGGGIGCQQSSPTVVNTMISGNHADSGGGIALDDLSGPTLTNNTLYGNTASASGGGMHCGNSTPAVTNCIFWHNTAPLGTQIHGLNALVTFSDVEGGWPGAGNLNGDPLFKDPSIHDFHLTFDSPCMDRGDSFAPGLPDLDYEGDPRVWYGIVDLGADEYTLGGGKVLHVPDEYTTIADAIDMAMTGDMVLVAPGTYVENINFGGKAITLKSSGGALATVIDVSGFGSSVVTFANGEGPDSVLDGFTLTNGFNQYGGGIRCEGASPTIRNNIIKGNMVFAWKADRNGGGIYCDGGSPLIADNIICDNNGGLSGGGIHCGGNGDPTIANNRIFGNWAMGGGGISIGDLYGDSASPIIRNNTIYGNEAYCGGGIGFSLEPSGFPDHGSVSHVTILNNTIYGNTAEDGGTDNGGGGIACIGGCYLVENTILWDNQAPLGDELLVGFAYAEPATLTVRHANLDGGQASVHVGTDCTLDWGPGMIDSDPLFVDAGGCDFHLTFNSPCRGSGNSAVPGLPETDFEGDPRVAYGTADMGADEFFTHLYWTGDAVQGGTVELKFTGLPGTQPVFFWLGSGALDPPLPTLYGYWHLQFPVWFLAMQGGIPAPDGVCIYQGTIPGGFPPQPVFMQALIGDALSNLCVMEVE